MSLRDAPARNSIWRRGCSHHSTSSTRRSKSKEICDSVPVEKDADVLSSAAREKFERGNADALLPPVVGAVREIFVQNRINPKGKRAVVIGRGFLVGAPAATWLTQQGAEVEIATSKTEDLSAVLRTADIIVSGAGSPHLIKPDMLKDGVVLIDAGTSESNGTLAGDADPACADKVFSSPPFPVASVPSPSPVSSRTLSPRPAPNLI